MTGTDVLIRSSREDLLTVCCHCHRVRDTDGEWEVRFVPESELVSHGICRSCFVEFYPKIPLPKDSR